MLAVEQHVTRALLTHADSEVRARAERFVEASLRDMPEHLRAGVLLESLAVGVVVAIACAVTRQPRDRVVVGVLDRLDRSGVTLLRQYPRLFRSLVVFAECETATVPA